MDRIESQSQTKRIFISRRDAAVRRIVNEFELATVCAEFGIEIVQLSSMDFIDQANLFNSAEFIMAPHGAGLVNVLFCQAGVKVLELMPTPLIPNFLYHSITTVAGGKYHYMYGRAVEGHSDATGKISIETNNRIIAYAMERRCIYCFFVSLRTSDRSPF